MQEAHPRDWKCLVCLRNSKEVDVTESERRMGKPEQGDESREVTGMNQAGTWGHRTVLGFYPK